MAEDKKILILMIEEYEGMSEIYKEKAAKLRRQLPVDGQPVAPKRGIKHADIAQAARLRYKNKANKKSSNKAA